MIRRCLTGALLALASATAAGQFFDKTLTPSTYRVEVQDALASPHPVAALLGVHSLWWGHQESLMQSDGTTHPRVVEWLRTTGGIMRFGGGVNELPWSACSAPTAQRRAYKAVLWAGPMVCRFGIPEYLNLTRQSNGKTGWVIANLLGIEHNEWTTAQMTTEMAIAARSFAALAKDMQRTWELGNELDRGRHLWSPERMAERASAAARAIREADPNAKLVLPLMDYDHPRQPKRTEYNERLLRAMTNSVDGIAHHIYYDGVHGGPSIPTQLKPLVESAELFRKLNGKPAEVWVTEHARWPDGETSDPSWRSRWYQSNDLSGVLGSADFLIALTQVEDVAGAMLHGMRAGPWNVFESVEGVLQLTGVGQLLDMFGRTGALHRLKTESSGPNRSGYRGGYDLRAAAFKTREEGEMVLWLVNRAEAPTKLFLQLPQSLQGGFRDGTSLVCPRPAGRCSGEQFRLLAMRASQLDMAATGLTVNLPAASVSVLRLRNQP